MSMMYPNGSPQPTSANQFLTGSQPNYGQGLVNFSQLPQQVQQMLQQRQQQAQQQPQAGQVSAPSGPNMGGKAPPGVTGGAGQPGGFNPSNFAAGLRKFFTPGAAQAAPGATAPGATNPAGFAPQAPAAQPQMAQPGSAGFGGGASMQSPMLPSSGAGFNPNGLY